MGCAPSASSGHGKLPGLSGNGAECTAATLASWGSLRLLKPSRSETVNKTDFSSFALLCS